ncbi:MULTISPECIES: CdaR family protein [Bacillaceae]|uniref:YbbR domain-containing protein n=1 Tax=Peribacillus huizhouensis TaxID=1501239 RepID=A0ABR6CWK2_9BACI|nr:MULTISPECIES: CdaR family protein [Bacillaceae]MBA9029392.1 YbbR domain-containing protein [Peribacillus huizhouensis]
MDKFMNSIWFTRIIAFAIAALLFISVNFVPNSKLGKADTSTPGENDTEIIKDVPVEVYYDQKNLVVTGAPETVDITLTGVKPVLMSAKSKRDFKVYIDLSDPDITMGDKKVPIKIMDLSEKLKAKIDPGYVTVNVQERVTEEFSVEPDYNRANLKDGYTTESLVIKPQTVKITGAKDTINQIAYVKAMLELNKDVKDTVNGQATVRALDRDLNKLNVIIEPASVRFTLKVNISSKTVPIILVQTGNVRNDLKIKSVTADQKEVVLYGKASVLQNIKEVKVPVDVSNIVGDKELDLPITVPDNVQRISREMVKVRIQTDPVVKEESPPSNQEMEQPKDQETSVQMKTKTISNLKIQAIGLPAEKQLEFLSPTDGVTSILIKGPEDELKKVNESNLQLSIKAADLEEGEHNLDIQVNAPSSITWELQNKQASISISSIKKDET